MRRIRLPEVSRCKHRSFSSYSASLQRGARDSTAHHVPASRTALPPRPQPTVVSDDGARTLRTRQHGNKVLPLPPLMDPIALEAKDRHKQSKLDPEEQGALTELQKELQFNFHARALADPIRQCAITRVKLPTHFLLPFTGTMSQSHRPDDSDSENPQHIKPRPELIPALAIADEGHNEPGPGTSYVINSHRVLAHLKRREWAALATPRIREKFAHAVGRKYKNMGDGWIWDPQMEERVLDDLRRHAVWTISYGLQRKRIVPMEALSEFSAYPPAAIIEVGTVTEPLSDSTSIETQNVNTYSMLDLLGEDISSEVLKKGEISETTSRLAVLRHHRNFKLLFALDKLDMYVKPRDLPGLKQRRSGWREPKKLSRD